MLMEKAAERNSLIVLLGMLMGPLRKLANQSPPPAEAEYRIAGAKLRHDLNEWHLRVSQFANVGGYLFDPPRGRR